MTVTVAYLGPAGTFTEAALWKFREQTLPDVTVQPLPVDSPAMALDAVRSGDADYACVAIENSVDGPVTPTFDALAAAPGVQIYGETDIDITFAIMMRPGFDSATIRTFSTHPVARQQVADWGCRQPAPRSTSSPHPPTLLLRKPSLRGVSTPPPHPNAPLTCSTWRSWRAILPTFAVPTRDSSWWGDPGCPPPHWR